MSLETRLYDIFRQAEAYPASPDLFARVERSIAEDRAHRVRVVKVMAAAGAAVATLAGFVLAMTHESGGLIVMPRWAAELVETVVLGALTVVMGPAIRRFGTTYAGDVFHIQPETGRRFLDLLDLAYYLVFAGLIFLGADLDRLGAPAMVGGLAVEATTRLAGLLLAMGILHSLTIVVLPVAGLIFAATTRRARRTEAGGGAPAASARAESAERVARLIVWALAGLAVGVILIGIGMLVIGIADM
ncbi:MAG: hypothetical protein ACT4OP_07380 [Actinomycetota bacterium]